MISSPKQVRAVASVTLMRVATSRTCPAISSAARCRSRCMPDAASSSRNTSILLSSHVRLGTWQVFHPPATEPGYIRTRGRDNPAVLSPLSPLAVPLSPESRHRGTPLEVIWLFPERSRLSRLMLGERAGSQQLGDAMPDDNARADDDTRKLRARFPRWGILFDPLESVWVAVRGKRTLVAASSPEKLTEQVEAAARGEAGPDEGARTQTWRALRKHGRG
jgi:hypothetical protein